MPCTKSSPPLPEFIYYMQDQAQDDAYDDAGDDGKTKAEILALDGDIARELPEIFQKGDGIPENQE